MARRSFTRTIRIIVAVAAALIVCAGCAGSVADEGVTTTIAPRPTSTPFPTLAPAPPATAVADAQADTAPAQTADSSATSSGLSDEAVAAAAEAAALADPADFAADSSDLSAAEIDPDAAPAFTTASKVTTVGLDEVYFGMTARAAGDAADTEWQRSSPSTSCAFLTPAGGPTGVRFWLWEGSVERVDVTNEGITTPSGFGVGSTLTDLVERLGDNLLVGDTSTGGRRAVFIPSDESDAEFRIIFEIGTDGTVTRYRSGRLGVVERDPAACT